jgi:hypothetical protein
MLFSKVLARSAEAIFVADNDGVLDSMRPNQHPYRQTPYNQPKVIAISATRPNASNLLVWHLALAGFLYSIVTGFFQ